MTKPRFGWNGHGVEIHDRFPSDVQPGRILQQYGGTPCTPGGGHFVVGAWIVKGACVALCVREESSRNVTGAESSFVPVLFGAATVDSSSSDDDDGESDGEDEDPDGDETLNPKP